MNETIKMRGRLLLFDVIDKCNWKIPRDCEINYPEKVPFISRIINYNDAKSVIGTAIIRKDELGLVCDVVIRVTDDIKDSLIDFWRSNDVYIGGIWHNVEKHTEGDVTVFDVINIYGIGITNNTASDEYKLHLVEERDVHVKPEYIVKKSHYENGVRVLDEVKFTGFSLVANTND